jgi:hypothetical protein
MNSPARPLTSIRPNPIFGPTGVLPAVGNSRGRESAVKYIIRLFLIAIVAVSIALPELAWSQVYFVCRKYNPEKNCFICTDYSSTSSEEDAQARCANRGLDEAHYFPSVGAVAAWKLGNCTCFEERRSP